MAQSDDQSIDDHGVESAATMSHVSSVHNNPNRKKIKNKNDASGAGLVAVVGGQLGRNNKYSSSSPATADNLGFGTLPFYHHYREYGI